MYNIVIKGKDPEVPDNLLLGASLLDKAEVEKWCEYYRRRYTDRKFETVKTSIDFSCPIPSGFGLKKSKSND